MDSLKNTLERNRNFVLYCFIGVSGVTLDTLTSWTLLWTGRVGMQPAYAIGYSAGTVLSFILNSRYNFKTSDWITLRFISFSLVAFLGWCATYEALNVLIGHYGFNRYLAKLPTMFIVVVLQYSLNRLISFRQARGPSNE
jgi:putative flippase GtrA